jgi:hypothetical protein
MTDPTPIDIPFPAAENLHLHLAVGACRLRLQPGEGPQWVAGTYSDPSNAVPLRIEQREGTVRISQTLGWPESWGPLKEPPTFDLYVGRSRPFALTLEGGASEAGLDLGGLPLRNLTIKYGAGKQDIGFSAPNPEPLQSLTVAGGAASITFAGLANANLADMFLEGGAAAYELDFGGALRRDAAVNISAAVSSVLLKVPASTAVKVKAEAVMGSVDTGDGFMKKEGVFWNEAALAGATPQIIVTARVTMGSLRLEQIPGTTAVANVT